MTFRETTVARLEESGLDWKTPVLHYEELEQATRGSACWHIERLKVLYRAFCLKLFGLSRQPVKNQVRINKKPWLADRYASTLGQGLLEQIVAEEAARSYQKIAWVDLSATASMRVILDECPTAAASVPPQLVESARELGAQAGYVIELWNRVVRENAEALQQMGVSDIASQTRRNAIVSFLTFFRVTGNILAAEGIRYLTVEQYRALLEDYCHREE